MLIFIFCHNVENSPNNNEITRPYFDDENSSEDDINFMRIYSAWTRAIKYQGKRDSKFFVQEIFYIDKFSSSEIRIKCD